MTPEQRDEFERLGVTRLSGAVDPRVAAAIRERVWEQAEKKQGVRRDDPSTWRRVAPSIMKPLVSEGLFDPILGPAPAAALDALLGEGRWRRPEHPGQLLMTPPHAGEWSVPYSSWHLDCTAPRGMQLPGVQLFLLLDRLGPNDGGTLVIAGSHRLVAGLPQRRVSGYEGRSADVRKALRRGVPWLRELWRAGGSDGERIERFLEHGSEHEGVSLRVVAMTGEPGDVFVTHLWTLHAGSMNTGARMRMMVTERLRALL